MLMNHDKILDLRILWHIKSLASYIYGLISGLVINNDVLS